MKKKKITRDFVALLLAFVMLLTSVPMAFAQNEEKLEEQKAVEYQKTDYSDEEEIYYNRFNSENLPSEEEIEAAAQPKNSGLLRSISSYDTIYEKVLRENEALHNSHRTDAAAMAAYASQTYTESTVSGETCVYNQNTGFAAVANQICANRSTDYQKVQAIHDWVCGHLYYNYDISQGRVARTSQSAFTMLNGILNNGGLDNGRYVAVCEGYSRLFRALCRGAGIPCVYVEGYASGKDWSKTPLTQTDDEYIYKNYISHAWNEVYTEQTGWIIIDCTWDSGNKYNYTPGAGLTNGSSKNTYFDIDESVFAQSHRASYYIDENLGTYVNDSTANYSNGTYNSATGVFTFNSGEQYIYCDMFKDLASLKKVVIPADTTILGIGAYAFDGCVNLEEIDEISKEVRNIGYMAFANTYFLKNLTIESGGSYYKSINENSIFTADNKVLLFVASKATNTILSIPDNTEYIETIATYTATTITSVNIPATMESLDTEISSENYIFGEPFAFKRWHSLKSITVSADNPKYKSDRGVLYSKDMTTLVKFPDSLNEVIIWLPDNLTTIMQNAIILPAMSSSLKCIVIDSSNPYFTTENDILYSKDKKTMYLLPPQNKSENVYYYDADGILTADEISETLNPAISDLITGRYVYYPVNIQSVVLDNVKTIDEFAFNCSNIKNFYGTDTVTEIGLAAFQNSTSLEYIDLSNVQSIGDNCFFVYDSSPITGVAIPKSATQIGKNSLSKHSEADEQGYYTITKYLDIYCSEDAPVRSNSNCNSNTKKDAPQFKKNIDVYVGGIGNDELSELSVEVYGFNMTYQWYKNDVAIYGATKRTYTPINDGKNATYTVVVKSKDGSDAVKTLTSDVCSAEIETYISEKCGPNASYYLDLCTGVLTITGEGEMDFSELALRGYLEYVTEIQIGYGITNIPAYAFHSGVVIKIKNVTIAETVTEIGENAFNYCDIENFKFMSDSNTITIASNAFENTVIYNLISYSNNTLATQYNAMGLEVYNTILRDFQLGVVDINNGAYRPSMSDALLMFKAVTEGDYSNLLSIKAADVAGDTNITMIDAIYVFLAVKNSDYITSKI
ncbi:MAG: leucine-rich repeat protein [Clostridiales bacterium]|nr:leucine-rich repeat protein [Clostridiales bacterium]